MTDDLATLDRLIEGARRHVDLLISLRSSVASDLRSEAESEAFADDFAAANMIELPLAAQRFEVSKDKLRRWCRDYGIGVLHGGRWMVSLPRLRRHIGR
ncbi:hypothetical protein N2597_07535 [Rhizobium sophoriradicis]|uniref:hypothetical protein n=1 Tax=Rhizobium sophoriradicis TaxID=1535245 RepID=UPI00160DEB84|nr:hypothetical protein N2597_07535 [Rhizobium leguminosarum bv. phaseoli]